MTGAANYAEAVFSLSEEMGNTEAVLADIIAARDAFSANPDYVKLTDTPALSVPEKLSLIAKAFAPLCETVRNLIAVLCLFKIDINNQGEYRNNYYVEQIRLSCKHGKSVLGHRCKNT